MKFLLFKISKHSLDFQHQSSHYAIGPRFEKKLGLPGIIFFSPSFDFIVCVQITFILENVIKIINKSFFQISLRKGVESVGLV